MADNDITIYDAHSRPVTKADTLSFAPQPKTPDGVMKTTPIDAAQIAAVANNPGRWPFDPGVPMQPVVQDGEPIQWPPAVGWNLLYDPNKKLGIPPYLLRAFSENCTSVRVIISQLISTAMGWDFGAVKEGTTRAHRKDTDAVRDGIKKWLKKPDGKRSMQRWLSIVVDDLTVIGAPSLARTVTLSGKPKGLKPIDSALVVPIVTASGDAPEPPAPAYYFTAYGLPYRQYTSDELLYEPMQEKSWTPFGVSPVEEVFAYIVLAINRGLYYSAYYDSGTVPAGIATCPKDWELEKIKQFADYFQTIMTGSVGKVHQLWWAPADTKIQAFKQHPDWQYDFDEFIFRLMAMRIGVDASPMVKQGGLGRPNEGLSEEALAAGIVPLKKYVATLLDTYIQDEGIGLTRVDPKTGKPRTFTRGLGQPDYHVEIIETREENKQQKLEEEARRLRLA